MVGFQTSLAIKLNLTGICYNENSFSKLTFTSSSGKVASLEGVLLA